MSVTYDNIVNVSIGIAPTPVALPGFGNLLFLTDESEGHTEVGVANRVQTFGSLPEVGAMYPQATYPEINAAATGYYAQVPTPQVFMVGAVLAANPTAGYIESNEHADLATLQAITAGGFSIEVDGVAAEAITALDFSAATSLNGVAIVVNTALTAATADATCIYLDGKFIIESGTAGASSTVEALTVDVTGTAIALGLLDTASPAPTVVAGAVGETALQGLQQCDLFDGTFNEVVSDKKWRDSATAIAISDYCQATKRIFGNTTNDANALGLATASGTIAGQIDAKSNGNTITSYSPVTAEYPSASVLGRINTVNYQGTNTTLTLMFKKLPTITVADLSTTQKKALESINVNSFLKVGSTSLYSDGRMAGGGWLDTVHGVAWLEKQVQLNVFNLLYTSTTKIPYTDAGIALVVQQVDLALRQAVRNGLVAAGNDSDGNYLPLGYEIFSVPVTQVSASDKGNRIYNGITFKAVGAGAIHGATITGSFSE
ncbi:MAG: DUF3383 family protein [Ekhidna sp.]|nr:DUF3383 family protein [Ekhidna sp.]